VKFQVNEHNVNFVEDLERVKYLEEKILLLIGEIENQNKII
jgi:hypothetical protein